MSTERAWAYVWLCVCVWGGALRDPIPYLCILDKTIKNSEWIGEKVQLGIELSTLLSSSFDIRNIESFIKTDILTYVFLFNTF